MHPAVRTPVLLVAVALAGCATPEPTKSLARQSRESIATVLDAYKQDLDVTKTYVTTLKSAALTLKAEADRGQANTQAALAAWKASATAEVKLRLLAHWDERVFKLLTTDLEAYVQAEYYPKANAVLRPLRDDFHAKDQAAVASPNNVALKLAAAQAQLRVAEYERRYAEALLTEIGYLHSALARARGEFMAQDLQLGSTSVAMAAPAPPSLRTDAIPPLAVPATDGDVAALTERRAQVERIDKAHEKAAAALNQYLESDGYSRVLAKSAIDGFARKVLDELNLPKLAGQASAKLGLPADLGAAFKATVDTQAKQTAEAASAELSRLVADGLSKAEDRLQKTFQDFVTKTNGRADPS